MSEEINKKDEILEEEEEENQELEVIAGDGTELDISPAYEHLNDLAPDTDTSKPKNIVIPKEQKKADE